MKKKVITIVLAAAALTGCQQNIQENNKAEVKATDPIDKELTDIQKQLQANHDLSLMVEKHNAVALWESELKGKAILTINMQDSLIRADKRPVLLLVALSDLFQANGKYFIEAEGYYRLVETHFSLEIQRDQINKINDAAPDDHFGIIAEITSVRKPRLKVSANPDSKDEPEIEFDASDVLLADGKCLDLLKLEPSK